MVCNWHAVLGRGVQPAVDHEKALGLPRKFLKLRCNYRGHSLTTRFGHAFLPKSLYNNATIFQAVVSHAVDESLKMATDGVRDPPTGKPFHMVVLNAVGDWSWLHKIGGFTRSYHNMERAGRQAGAGESKRPVEICQLCRAGQLDVPYEELHTRQPRWLGTLFVDNPWVTTPSFCRLWHAPGQAAGLFAWDIFHSWHLGVGKAHVSSCLAILSELEAGGNVDARFEALSQEFIAWSKRERQPRLMAKLSKEFLGWATKKDYPGGSWHKGAITTTLMKFLEYKLARTDLSADALLPLASEATTTMNLCLQKLYQHDEVFLEPSVASAIGELGLRFLRRFSSLARGAFDEGRCLWPLLPKLHSLHHIFITLVQQAGSQHVALHPLCHGTQQDEDYVGRPSRLSRRVAPQRASERCLQRYLKHSYEKYVEAKLIVP